MLWPPLTNRKGRKEKKKKSVKSTFAHGGDSEKTKRSMKSAAIVLIKFDSNHSCTVTTNVHTLNIYINMKYRHNKTKAAIIASKKQ